MTCISGGGNLLKPSFYKTFQKLAAFTLAEVLITLGIIGVVAAMTIPNLIANAQKKATAMKVKAFYSKINQAVRLSSADNEDPEGWKYPDPNSYPEMQEFLATYFHPYIKLSACENHYIDYEAGAAACTLLDGGVVIFGYVEGLDIYYITDYKAYQKAKNSNTDFRKDFRHSFAFSLQRINSGGYVTGVARDEGVRNSNFVVPYSMDWRGTREDLLTHEKYGCNKYAQYPSYCTKLISDNGWEIPKDYPW